MRKTLLLIFITINIFNLSAQNDEQILLPPASILSKQAVGRIEISLKDISRIDIASQTNSTREFNVQIWYPSEEKQQQTLPFISKLDQYSTLVSELEFERFRKGRIAVLENLNVSPCKEQYPVVLFSPGFGMNKAYYSSFCHFLAQNHFIVVAIDHPYINKTILRDGMPLNPKKGYFDSFPATKPASSIEMAKKRFKEVFDYLNKDINFIVKKLADLNKGNLADGLFNGRLNLEKIAHIGHSAGALVTKSLMSNSKSDFSAFVTFDVRLDQEFLSATEQVEIPNNTEKPILMFALEYVQQYSPFPSEDFLKKRKGNFHHVSLKDTGHSAMSDLDYLYYKDQKEFAKANLAEEKMLKLFTITSSFLSTYLKL